jgi:hypothetical protein
MHSELPSGPDPHPEAVRSTLERTQPWVRFLAIVAFAYVGLMIVGGLIAGAFLLASGQMQAVAFLFIYPLLGVLYVYPALCLLRYANGIRAFTQTGHERDLVSALDAQRVFWKFVGVLTAIGIALMVLGLVLGVLLGVVMGVAGMDSIGQ